MVRDGKPIVVEPGQWVRMDFFEVNPKVAGESFPADVEANGSFEVPGKEGDGVPPGKYKVVIRWVTFQDRNTDRLQGAFAQDKTPLVYEIEGSKKLTIDLSPAAKGS